MSTILDYNMNVFQNEPRYISLVHPSSFRDAVGKGLLISL